MTNRIVVRDAAHKMVANRPRHRLSAALFLVFICIVNVWAEDLNVFLRSDQMPTSVRPNLLFVIDAPQANAVSPRITDAAVKNIVSHAIGQLSGVNVGLYAVEHELPLRPVESVRGQVQVPTPILKAGADDVVALTAQGNVQTNTAILPLASDLVPSMESHAITVSVSDRVSPSVERISNDRYSAAHPNVEFDAVSRLGLRFDDLGIPAGAVIEAAYLTFVAEAPGSGDVTFALSVASAHQGDLAAPLTMLMSSTAWQISEEWREGDGYHSPDISALVQHEVDKMQWSTEQGLVLLLDHLIGESDRSVFLTTASEAVKKDVVASDVVVNDVIASDVVVSDVVKSDPIEVAPEAPPQPQSETELEPESQSQLQSELQPESNPTAAASVSAEQTTVALAPQETVDANANANVEVEVEAATTEIELANSEAGPEFDSEPAAKLEAVKSDSLQSVSPESIADSPTVSETPTPAVAQKPVRGKRGKIDPQWIPQLTIKYATPTGAPIKNPKIVGLRFSDVPIPKGAEVRLARLDFHAAEDADVPANYKVSLQTVGDSPAFSADLSIAEFIKRAENGRQIQWAVEQAWEKDQLVLGPVVTDLVQQHVSSVDGWCGNNAMTFFISPADAASARAIYAQEHDPALQARLHLEYEPQADDACRHDHYRASGEIREIDGQKLTVQYHALPFVQGAEIIGAHWQWPGVAGGDEAWQVLSVQGLASDQAALREAVQAAAQATDWRAGNALTVQFERMPPADGQPLVPVTKAHLPKLNLKIKNGGLDFSRNTVRREIMAAVETLPVKSILPAKSVLPQGQVYGDAVQYFQARIAEQRTQHQCQANHIIWLTQSDDQVLCADASGENCKRDSDLNAIETHRLNLERFAAPEDFRMALQSVLHHITATPVTFTQPGITVNNFNPLSHQDAVFYSVFQPRDSASWSGNLKRFQVAGDPPILLDATRREAVNAARGYFHAGAKSAWPSIRESSEQGGDSIAHGAHTESTFGVNTVASNHARPVSAGAAGVLVSTLKDRKVYTYLAPTELAQTEAGAAPAVSSSAKSLQALHENNKAITAAMLGADSAQMRESILQWARGVDVKDWDGDGDHAEFRQQLGAPIHSAPALATYGGSHKSPDMAVFFGTHDGKFHAVNAQTGAEYFAFVPEQFLPLLKDRYVDEAIEAHAYGVDGSPTVWVYDANGDNQIEIGSDHVYVYFGLRRGGRDYFALDVTDRSAPTLLWHIQGGSPQFERLGQSWAQPVKTKVDVNGQQKDVLILGGGFDPAADRGASGGSALPLGHAIYMVDARTGERLWWGSGGEAVAAESSDKNVPNFTDERFRYAIPSALSVVDVNGDDLMDQMYVGDLGGQVWRFDVHNGRSENELVSGGVIAQLATAAPADARQFFFPPQLALLNRRGAPALGVVIGSGAINRPLAQTVEDRLFVLFQKDVFEPAETISPIGLADLADYSQPDAGEAVKDAGWFMRLPASGEKVLSSPLVVNNNVLVSTYSPVSAEQGSCQAVVGQGSVYLVGLLDGKPVADLDESGTINLADRRRALKSLGIPPSPVVLFAPSSDQPLVMIGAELPLRDVDLALEADWQTVYWYE